MPGIAYTNMTNNIDPNIDRRFMVNPATVSKKRVAKETISIVFALALIPFLTLFAIDIKHYLETLKELIVTWYIFPVSMGSFYLFWLLDVLNKPNINDSNKIDKTEVNIFHLLNKEAGSAFVGFFLIFSSFTVAIFLFLIIIKIPVFNELKNALTVKREFGGFTDKRYLIVTGILLLGTLMSIGSSMVIRYVVETLNSYRELPAKVAVIKGFSLLILFIIWTPYYALLQLF